MRIFMAFMGSICVTVLLSSCALKSPTHMGITKAGQGTEIIGVISEKSAREAEIFVGEFHRLISSARYQEAYDLLSADLQADLPLERFRSGLENLNSTYGPETSFRAMTSSASRILPPVQKGSFEDAFTYYDAVSVDYLSRREEDVIYSFELKRVGTGLRIISLVYQTPADPLEFKAVKPF